MYLGSREVLVSGTQTRTNHFLEKEKGALASPALTKVSPRGVWVTTGKTDGHRAWVFDNSAQKFIGNLFFPPAIGNRFTNDLF